MSGSTVGDPETERGHMPSMAEILMEQSSDALFAFTSSDQRVMSPNRAFCSMFGYSQEQAANLTLPTLFPELLSTPDGLFIQDRVTSNLNPIPEEGVQTLGTFSSGHTFDILLKICEHVDPRRDEPVYSVSVRDITEVTESLAASRRHEIVRKVMDRIYAVKPEDFEGIYNALSEEACKLFNGTSAYVGEFDFEEDENGKPILHSGTGKVDGEYYDPTRACAEERVSDKGEVYVIGEDFAPSPWLVGGGDVDIIRVSDSREGSPAELKEYEHMERYGTQISITVPVRTNGVPTHYIEVYDSSNPRLELAEDGFEVEALLEIANRVAVYIEKARVIEEYRKRNETLEIMTQLDEELDEAEGLPEVYSIISRWTTIALGGTSGSVCIIKGQTIDDDGVVHLRGAELVMVGEYFEQDATDLERTSGAEASYIIGENVIDDGWLYEPGVVDVGRKVNGQYPAEREEMAKYQINLTLSTALMVDGKTTGSIDVWDTREGSEDRVIPQSSLDLLTAIAGRASVRIEKMKLVENLAVAVQELGEKSELLEIIAQIITHEIKGDVGSVESAIYLFAEMINGYMCLGRLIGEQELTENQIINDGIGLLAILLKNNSEHEVQEILELLSQGEIDTVDRLEEIISPLLGGDVRRPVESVVDLMRNGREANSGNVTFILTKIIKSNEEDPLHEVLNVILASSKRVRGVLEALSDLRKIDGEDFEKVRTIHDMRVVVEEIIEEGFEEGDTARVEVVGDTWPTLKVHLGLIQRVIRNYVSNAIKYGGTGSIKVGCKETDGEYHFYVSDQGSGIPEKYLEGIFLPFKRLQIAIATKEGDGLGLYLVAKVAGRHGGKAWAESVREGEGTGSTFWFSLPKE